MGVLRALAAIAASLVLLLPASAQQWQRPGPYYLPYDQQPVPPRLQPGFDCTRAYRITERAICSDPSLADADAKLKQAYEKTLEIATNRDDVQSSQRKWLAQRNQFCDAAPPHQVHECILNSDNQRIAALNEARVKVQKEITEKARVAKEREAAEQERQAAEDAGYDRVSFDDYLLDAKKLQASGRKIVVRGFYRRTGGIEELNETFLGAMGATNATPIFILTEDATRDFRAGLLRCNSLPEGANVCPVKVRGYVSSCTLTLLGNSVVKPCVVVESGALLAR